MPERIQRRRAKGWRMPPGAVYVGRPTKWGNPFRTGDDGVPDSATAVRLFRDLLAPHPAHIVPLYMTLDDIRRELRGRVLACWCPLDQPCHADVLLELANAVRPEPDGTEAGHG